MRPILLAVIALMLVGCQGRQQQGRGSAKSAEEERIEREVAQRVETAAATIEAKSRLSLLHTIRLTGFAILTGGAVVGLLWLRHPRSRAYVSEGHRMLPQQDNHPALGTERVIEFEPPARRQPVYRNHRQSNRKP